jgi:predicted ABC-type ATPase
MPVLTVVAGPNGTGKSTMLRTFRFEGQDNLLDTDAVAKRLNPADPLQAAVTAGREVISRARGYIAESKSFVMETTLSGNLTVNLMRSAQGQGFTVNLVYIYIESSNASMKRVRDRAAKGGHFVPDEDVRRRYDRSLFHLREAIRVANSAVVFDNSQLEPRRLVEIDGGAVNWIAQDLPTEVKQIILELQERDTH